MNRKEIDEFINSDPKLRKVADKFVILTEEDKIMMTDPKNSVTLLKGQLGIVLNVEFLHKLLFDEYYLGKIQDAFNKNMFSLQFRYIFHGDLSGIMYNSISLTDLGKLLKMAIDENKLHLSEEEYLKYNYIQEQLEFSACIESIKNRKIRQKVDGEEVIIDNKLFFDFLMLAEDKFNSLLKKDNELIFNYPKEIFIYMLTNYFAETQICSRYYIPEEIQTRVKQLEEQANVDYYYVNKINEIKDKNIEKVVLNKDLKDLILSGMPANYSKLQQAIYIYIKMCKLLSYDDEFYVSRQSGDIADYHSDIKNLANITPQNRIVVCYSFNALYAKMLNELDIKYEVITSHTMEDEYGRGHSYLAFKVGKFITFADSVTSILEGDLVKAKLNEDLKGLYCKNKNEETLNEFEQIKAGVYRFVVEQEQQQKQKKTFSQLLKEYEATIESQETVSIKDRIDIMMAKAKEFGKKGVDNLGFIHRLKRLIFTDQELNHILTIVIIKNNIPDSKTKKAKASVIFSILYTNSKDKIRSFKYYYYDALGELIPISQQELENMFNDRLFEYIDIRGPRIPGLKVSDGVNLCF